MKIDSCDHHAIHLLMRDQDDTPVATMRLVIRDSSKQEFFEFEKQQSLESMLKNDDVLRQTTRMCSLSRIMVAQPYRKTTALTQLIIKMIEIAVERDLGLLFGQIIPDLLKVYLPYGNRALDTSFQCPINPKKTETLTLMDLGDNNTQRRHAVVKFYQDLKHGIENNTFNLREFHADQSKWLDYTVYPNEPLDKVVSSSFGAKA